jgi:hypothetical protein
MHDVYLARIALLSPPMVADRNVTYTLTRLIRYRVTDAARRVAKAGSPFAYPVQISQSPFFNDFAKVAIATTDTLLSVLT